MCKFFVLVTIGSIGINMIIVPILNKANFSATHSLLISLGFGILYILLLNEYTSKK